MSQESRFPESAPPVGIVMGSRSDWATMKMAATMLQTLQLDFEAHVVSAHRTPARLSQYASTASKRGVKVIIAGAGGAAHLPGMVASETNLPVLGVPIQSRALQGLDSLLSIVQMPGGVPVATMAIGESGAKNAALFAARILSLSDASLATRVETFVDQQSAAVIADGDLTADVKSLSSSVGQ